MMRGDCSNLENMPPISINMPVNRRQSTESKDCSPQASPGVYGLTGQPVKEGNVYAIQNIGGKAVRIPVVLKVYASNFEHYAVVSQDKAICRDCGYINLKHCSVQSSSSSTDRWLQERGNVPSPFNPRMSSSPTSTSWLHSSPGTSPPSSMFASSSPRNVTSPVCISSSSPGSHQRSLPSSHCSSARLPSSYSPSGSPPRNGSPTHNQHWFEVIPTKAEGQTLSFSVCSRTELEQWMSVLVPDMPDLTATEASPKVVLASPLRKALGDASGHRVVSPKLGKKPAMPSLEEE